jgi:hypothetical protein
MLIVAEAVGPGPIAAMLAADSLVGGAFASVIAAQLAPEGGGGVLTRCLLLLLIPRLRDVGDLWVPRLGARTWLPVDAVLGYRARPDRIRDQYDDLVLTAV